MNKERKRWLISILSNSITFGISEELFLVWKGGMISRSDY